jgi:hypothetical protein
VTAQSCSCPDDRCVGYHHAAGEPCLCGPAARAAVVVPEEAIDRAHFHAEMNDAEWHYPCYHDDPKECWKGDQARELVAGMLAAAAPFIVEANQPEPAHEVECPACGATIRARMADAPEVVAARVRALPRLAPHDEARVRDALRRIDGEEET